MFYDIIKLMRVHHYLKNFLIFAALAFSGQLFNSDKFVPGCMGFLAFCCISSVVYIINDIRDREKDRNHPTKKDRPIASGAVPVQVAIVVAVVLFLIAWIFNFMAFSMASSILLAIYFIINLGYSFGLKNVPIVDITILSVGFLLRIMYGAIITNIVISNWLYLTVIAIAFYFSLGKRRNELRNSDGKDTRAVLKSYPEEFLDKNMYMCLGLANTFYALWSMEQSSSDNANSEFLIFTAPIVLLITMKYSMNIEGDSDGDPVEVLLHDKVLLALSFVYALTMFVILYI